MADLSVRVRRLIKLHGLAGAAYRLKVCPEAVLRIGAEAPVKAATVAVAVANIEVTP